VTTLRPNRIDLHCHTRRSDGVLEPLELYRQMRAYGMRLVAVTDHDTLAGYRELRAAGLGATPSPDGPQLVPALEINSIAEHLLERHGFGRDGEELHIVGLGVDPDEPALAATLARQRDGRRRRIELTLQRLAEEGMPVDRQLESLALRDVDSLGRPHVARALVLAGHAESVDDAFARLIGYGAPGYVPRQGIGTREAIESICRAGGLPVLAHAPAAPDRPEVIDELIGWGLVGIEVYYRTFTPETIGRMAAFAAERRLLPSGGSDYHGDTMDYAEAQATTFVPDEVGERLLAALAARAARAR
jgi:predicted metal-dependent phosphoesterase TrpH